MLKMSRVLVVLLGLVLLIPAGARAQQGVRYFPETGHVIGGGFLRFWENNGGLAVFGYPLTDEMQENGRTVQYFERQRFEWHPENRPPYDVLLGRLGDEILHIQGVDWRSMPQANGPAAGCVYFAATKHNVCNQQRGIGFLSYWQSHGLEFDGRRGTSYAESLALFGMPLTEPYQYTNSSGETVQSQWFERARFEWHPDKPNQFKVLLGLLGTELRRAQGDQRPPGSVDRVKIHFVALEDNGQTGKAIGCGDSVIPVEVTIQPTTAPMPAAFQRLLSLHDQFYGESGFYNALYQSNLSVDSATVENGTATVYLSGSLVLGGVCDNPRVAAQLEETARQFSYNGEVAIFINGQPLADVLSER